MGVSKDGVAVHLAWARFDFAWGLGVEGIVRDLEELTGDGRELFTAVGEEVYITRLDTAIYMLWWW